MGAFLETIVGLSVIVGVLVFSASLVLASETVVSYIKKLSGKGPTGP